MNESMTTDYTNQDNEQEKPVGPGEGNTEVSSPDIGSYDNAIFPQLGLGGTEPSAEEKVPLQETFESTETPAEEDAAIDIHQTEACDVQNQEDVAAQGHAEDTVSNTLVPAELEKDDFFSAPAFYGLCAAFVLGALLCALAAAVFGKVKKGRRTGRLKIKGVAVQGIGSRPEQQDALFLSDTGLYKEQGIIMCLADGMGGLENGKMYSSVAVSAVANSAAALAGHDPRSIIITAIKNANLDVNRLISPNYGSGGTTLLVGMVAEDEFFYASVGDSRIGLCRDGVLHRLNRLHTYADELFLCCMNGQLEYANVVGYEKSGALTSYLGMGTLKYADFPEKAVKLRKKDRLIFMSDGVYNALTDEEIASLLGQPIEKIAGSLSRSVERKKMSFQDNYSAVILAID